MHIQEFKSNIQKREHKIHIEERKKCKIIRPNFNNILKTYIHLRKHKPFTLESHRRPNLPADRLSLFKKHIL